MDYDLLWELAGYIASLLFLPALLRSTRPSYKWFSLAGSLIFIIYGLVIKAYPVCLANVFVALITSTILYKKYFRKEFFKVLETRTDNYYLSEFLEYYKKDIFHYFPNFEFNQEKSVHCFFILRNMNFAGLFLTSKYNDSILYLEMDYVIPGYRDFRTGMFLYQQYVEVFRKQGYIGIISPCFNRKHEKYLKKMGFELSMIDEKRQFVKSFK
ncbi:MAG: hypothetical protein U9R19_14025 [Bacteroidota bacterium]|nr:hypothetical protein [Bacteroidota bacterium]